MKFILGMILISPALIMASDFRGNLNLNYQGSRSRTSTGISNFGQILNLYVSDRLFYGNDMTLGAFIFNSKSSNRQNGDFRVRYNLYMAGYRYSFYSSYSPYKLSRPYGISEKIRVFQASINYQPKLLPDISSSYTSTRQFSTDKPRSRDGFNYLWNIGTQFSKSVGTFSANYQRRKARADLSLPQAQLLQSVNLGYDISKQYPLRINWSGSYNFTGTRNEVPDKTRDDSRTHLGAFQLARSFGKWLSAGAATSGRFSEFENGQNLTHIDNILSGASVNIAPRENITINLLRGYSLDKNRDDSTTRTINDYLNLGGTLTFDIGADANARFSLSRSLYYRSALGQTTVDNATMILAMSIYRETDATINLGLAHNDKTPSGFGKYQMTQNINIVSRPARLMTININFQSSLSSNNINFINNNSSNLAVSLSHALKPYFNYSTAYTRAMSRKEGMGAVSVMSLAANCQLSRQFSLLVAYSRRDLGKSTALIDERIGQSISGRLSWLLTPRSNLTANYSIANINRPHQIQSYGGYFTLDF